MSGYGLAAGIYGAIDQRWIFLIHCVVLLASGLLLLRGNTRLASRAKGQEVSFISSFKQFISEAKNRLSKEHLSSSFLRQSCSAQLRNRLSHQVHIAKQPSCRI